MSVAASVGSGPSIVYNSDDETISWDSFDEKHPSTKVAEPVFLKPNWEVRELTIKKALKKMWNNRQKAIEEHYQDFEKVSMVKNYNPYISPKEAAITFEKFFTKKDFPVLSFTHQVSEKCGSKGLMEDVHFFSERPFGFVAGICDGHGGNAVSKFVSCEFLRLFDNYLKESQSNFHGAFDKTIHHIDAEIAKHLEWVEKGSTFVISAFERETSRIYTATLGHCEGNIYRLYGEELKSIPLSCIRNWSSKKDMDRASQDLGEVIKQKWPRMMPHEIRYPHKDFGVSISRTMGDVHFRQCMDLKQSMGLTSKPKIAVEILKEHDVVVLASNGFKDVVPEMSITEFMDLREEDIATYLGNLCEHWTMKNKVKDDMTVLVIKMSVQKDEMTDL